MLYAVLTDNDVQFTDPKSEGRAVDDIQSMLKNNLPFHCVGFGLVCARNDIDHGFTKTNHLWTNGQAERISFMIKAATVRRYHYDTHDQIRPHPEAFINAYNFAKQLKTLKGLTPFEFIVQQWTKNQTASQNTQSVSWWD